MTKLEEQMFQAMDVAIQWIDDNEVEKARKTLADVYVPILQKAEDQSDDAITYVDTYHSDQVAQHGYAKFNPGPHLCVDVRGGATISVKLPDGKQVTFAFVSASDPKTTNSHECCDVCVSHDRQQVMCNPDFPYGDDRVEPLQKGIMFHGGCKTESVEGTLLTVLLSNKHLDRSKSGYGVLEAKKEESVDRRREENVT